MWKHFILYYLIFYLTHNLCTIIVLIIILHNVWTTKIKHSERTLNILKYIIIVTYYLKIIRTHTYIDKLLKHNL